jgi:5-methylcytosine-specific restriction endonuclease McrA
MPTDQVFADVNLLSEALRQLRANRQRQVIAGRSTRLQRRTLSPADRNQILSKTGSRCHLCGGSIGADEWQADHVLAHSTGGVHSVDNYLPAHSICNNYRWHYDAEEFQWILKLGVWLRTQIENNRPLGRMVGQKFCEHEQRRAGRRKPVARRAD